MKILSINFLNIENVIVENGVLFQLKSWYLIQKIVGTFIAEKYIMLMNKELQKIHRYNCCLLN